MKTRSIRKKPYPAPTPDSPAIQVPEPVNIYAYFDYRGLLKDLYDERKRLNANFSYRFIGQKAGFKSAGFFTLVLQGKSNISTGMALRIAVAFKFKKLETEFFESLVLFNQAMTQSEKKHYFNRILQIRKSKLKTMDVGQYQLFEEWYYLVIRAILDFKPFKDDFKGLAQMVKPAITAAQAKKAVEVLESLGSIKRNEYGTYEVVDVLLTTGDVWQSVVITNYQQSMLDLARQSFDFCDRAERDHSTLTLTLSEDSFLQIKDRLATLRREMLEITKHERKADRVCQVNFQVFSLTKSRKRP